LVLGKQRALAVQQALVEALNRRSAGIASQLEIIPQTAGEKLPVGDPRTPAGRAHNRRVAIFLDSDEPGQSTPQPTAPGASSGRPQSPTSARPIRIPTPEEVARRRVPIRPETPEERLNRILRTPLPSRPPRRSFSQMFWRALDNRLNATMGSLNIPSAWRNPIREAAHAAIRRGGEAGLNAVMDLAGLGSQAKEAVRATVRGALQMPIP
jgi:hypothetical protein